jgi:hypothetical protein
MAAGDAKINRASNGQSPSPNALPSDTEIPK